MLYDVVRDRVRVPAIAIAVVPYGRAPCRAPGSTVLSCTHTHTLDVRDSLRDSLRARGWQHSVVMHTHTHWTCVIHCVIHCVPVAGACEMPIHRVCKLNTC